MKKLSSKLGLLALALFGVLSIAAVTDTGIPNNFGGITRLMMQGALHGNATVGVKGTYTSALSDDHGAAVRGDLDALSGGVYSQESPGHQTTYTPFDSNLILRTAGTGNGYATAITQYGRGNALAIAGTVACSGGGEVTGSDSIPECGGGELVFSQGSQIFRGTITGSPASSATVITYTSPTNESVIGRRFILNKNHTYTTGTLSSISAYRINFTGSVDFTTPRATTVTSGGTGWYLKLGTTNDDYTPPCSGDDVEIDSKCVGHWYHVSAFPVPMDSSPCSSADKCLDTDIQFDTKGLLAGATPGATFTLMQGAEIQAFDTTANTVTIRANNFAWSNSDVLYSPPNHHMRMKGWVLDFRKTFKTLAGPALNQGDDSDGIALISRVQPLDNALLISGDLDSGTVGGFYSGIKFTDFSGTGTMIDSSTVDWTAAAISIKASDGSNNKIKMGSGQIYDDGTNVKIAGHPLSLQSTGIGGGILGDGGGLKHKRGVTTGSVGASSNANVTVTWGSAFADTNYTAICDVNEASSSLSRLPYTNKGTTSILVPVHNNDSGSAHTGTVECIAIHD